MTTQAASRPARRPLSRLAVVGGLLIALALGARLLHQGRPKGRHAHETGDLTRLGTSELLARLNAEEHTAAAARDVLVDRLGNDALPHLARLLEHPRPSTRAVAVEGVVEVAGKPLTRRDRLSVPTTELVAALEKRMSDYDALTRLRVIEGIRRVAGPAALPVLLSALRDEDDWIRERAARELGDLRARKSVGSLIAGLADPSSAVVGLAARGLQRITDERIPYRFAGTRSEQQKAVRRWRQWWAAHKAEWPATPVAPPFRITGSAPAPPFAVRFRYGRPLRLADMRGQIVLLNFFGSWCFPCVEELPGLANLQRRYEARGLRIIGLGVSEKSEADLRRFAEQRRLPFPVAIAPEEVLDAYGDIHEVPVSFLIDRRGQIRRIWEGDRTEATFEAALTRLLNEALSSSSLLAPSS